MFSSNLFQSEMAKGKKDFRYFVILQSGSTKSFLVRNVYRPDLFIWFQLLEVTGDHVVNYFKEKQKHISFSPYF